MDFCNKDRTLTLTFALTVQIQCTLDQHAVLEAQLTKEREDSTLKYDILQSQYNEICEENSQLKNMFEKFTEVCRENKELKSIVTENIRKHEENADDKLSSENVAMRAIQLQNQMLTNKLAEKDKRDRDFKQKLEFLKVQNTNLVVQLQGREKSHEKLVCFMSEN